MPQRGLKTPKAVATTVVAIGISAMVAVPTAQADEVAYLVNVTMRPGYNFANADAALEYGRGICDRVSQGASYSDDIAAIKADFATNDDYQAAYLINQAVNELCPELIWQLRRSAAHYTPEQGTGG
ncbi:MAG: DUF732 domain-containing protein [Mycobacterium sp.]